MPASTISIRPTTESEVSSLIRLADAAFGRNAIANALFPESREPDPDKRWDAEFEFRSGRVMAGLKNPQRRYITAVETAGAEGADGGSVAGWAAWEVKDLSKEEGSEDESKWAGPDGITLPPAADVEAIQSFGANMDEAERKTLDRLGVTKGIWTLLTIAVHPDHQRKGVGRILLDWGVNQAREEKKDVYLVSMPVGRALYLGAGFEDVGRVDMFGIEGTEMFLRVSA